MQHISIPAMDYENLPDTEFTDEEITDLLVALEPSDHALALIETSDEFLASVELPDELDVL